MKETYITAEMQIMCFEAEDIITDSSTPFGKYDTEFEPSNE